MPSYLVSWQIEVEAETPEAAAREALAIHRDPESIATVFFVVEAASYTKVDLTENTVTHLWGGAPHA